MRKTQLFKVVSLMALAMLLLISCSKDEPKSEYDGIYEYSKYKEYYDALFNTSWKVEEYRSWYYEDGKWEDLRDNLDYNFYFFGGDEIIITFTNKNDDGILDVICNLWPNAETREWCLKPTSDCDQEYMNFPWLIIVYYGYRNGKFQSLALPYGPITEFSQKRIVIDYTFDDGYKYRTRAVLTRIATPSQDNKDNYQQSK